MPNAPPTHRPNHLGSRKEVERERQQDLGQRRGSAASRGYGHKWRKTRLHYLRAHPLCVCCFARRNRTEAATVVDHIIPFKGDAKLQWDRSNWQGLCDTCDKTIKPPLEHAYERGEIGPDALDLSRPPGGEGGSNP